MAEELLQLVPFNTLGRAAVQYSVDFNGRQRHSSGMRYRFGHSAANGPVLRKSLSIARPSSTFAVNSMSPCGSAPVAAS